MNNLIRRGLINNPVFHFNLPHLAFSKRNIEITNRGDSIQSNFISRVAAGDFHEEIRGVLERGGREERRSNLTSNIVDISASYGLASNIQ